MNNKLRIRTIVCLGNRPIGPMPSLSFTDAVRHPFSGTELASFYTVEYFVTHAVPIILMSTMNAGSPTIIRRHSTVTGEYCKQIWIWEDGYKAPYNTLDLCTALANIGQYIDMHSLYVRSRKNRPQSAKEVSIQIYSKKTRMRISLDDSPLTHVFVWLVSRLSIFHGPEIQLIHLWTPLN